MTSEFEFLSRIHFPKSELESSLDQIKRTLKPERIMICYQASPDEDLELACQFGFQEGIIYLT